LAVYEGNKVSGDFGSVEVLERNKQSLVGALFYIVLPPPPPGHPLYYDNHQKVDEKPKIGGKGMLPACCLPLWGREGVTLLAAAKNKRIIEKEDFNKAVIS
jgi:hypothetical protein